MKLIVITRYNNNTESIINNDLIVVVYNTALFCMHAYPVVTISLIIENM